MNDSMELTTVDAALDRRRVGDMTVEKFGGLAFTEYREAVEFAKLMCQSRHSIPKYLKQNAGDCLAIVTQALRWSLEPYWVAQHSYIARDDQDTLIAYDAAVHAAIILSVGKLKGRPRYVYEGEGDDRTCTVLATFVGETDPHEYTTPPLRKCRPPTNDRGQVKGSPLWIKDPDQQLGYYAIRNWGRRHCPQVLGGVYDREEFGQSSQDEEPSDASPRLMERLSGRMEGPGFSPTVVDEGLADPTPEQDRAFAAGAHLVEPERKPRGRPRKPKDEPAVIEAVAEPEPTPADPEPSAEPVEALIEAGVVDGETGEFIDLEAFDGGRFIASVKMALHQAKDEKDMRAVKDDIIAPNKDAAVALGDGTWDRVVLDYRARAADLGLAPKAAPKPAQKPVDAPKPVPPSKVPGMAADAPSASKLATPGTADHPGFYADGRMRFPIYAKQYPTWVKGWLEKITDPVKVEEQWLDDADIRKELRMVTGEIKAARAIVDAELAKRKKAK